MNKTLYVDGFSPACLGEVRLILPAEREEEAPKHSCSGCHSCVVSNCRVESRSLKRNSPRQRSRTNLTIPREALLVASAPSLAVVVCCGSSLVLVGQRKRHEFPTID